MNDKRIKHLKRYGNFCMAYSTLEDGFNYFEDASGYISYASNWFRTFAFFDPVVDEKNKSSFLKEFTQRFDPVFIQISEDTAKILLAQGYAINSMGIETRIDISNFCVKGKPKAIVRKAINRAVRNQIEIEEIDDNFNYEDLKNVSKKWINTRTKKQPVKFITRSAKLQNEIYVRKFIVKKYNEIIGFTFYDPIFHDGEIIGYTPSVSRFVPDAFKGINYFTNFRCMEQFQSEGIKFIDLGLSPLYCINDDKFEYRKVINIIFNFLYKYGNFIYSFKGLAEHKRQYRAQEIQKYIAIKSGCSIPVLFNGFNLMKLI